MAETHELGGSTVVVDRATPKASYSMTSLSFLLIAAFFSSAPKKVLSFWIELNSIRSDFFFLSKFKLYNVIFPGR